MLVNISQIRKFATDLKELFTIQKLFQLKPLNEKLSLTGWLKYKSTFKDVHFVHLDDGSSLQRLQVVVPKSLMPKGLAYHAFIRVEGRLVKSKGWKQDIELLAEKIKVISPGAPLDYPFVEKATYLKEDLRVLPQYRSRTKEFASLLRVRSQAKMAFRKYFERKEFIQIDTPIITSNNCEGGGEVFSVKAHSDVKSHDSTVKIGDGAFGHPAFLTVSGQLHLEAMVNGLTRVYCFNPAFRADGNTRHHLHEFWMVETEEVLLEGRAGYTQLLDRIEEMLKFVCNDLLSTSQKDIDYLWEFTGKKEILKELVPKIIETPFVRLKYSEAIEILNRNQNELEFPTLEINKNLNRESEMFLTKYFDNAPVFITDWPSSLKPFYTYVEKEESGEEMAFGVDLLMPFVGEVVGGGLREHNLKALRRRLTESDPDNLLNWYLRLREWGYAPTGGCGLGFERFLQFFLGVDNIKDTIPFPRSNGQCLC